MTDIKFNYNQKEFPTSVHRAIWDKSVHLMLPEISLENINDERKEPFLDLYNYLQAVYADMYDNPSEYHLDPYGIDELLVRQTWRQAMISAGWNKQKDKLNKLREIEIVNLPRMFISFVSENMELAGVNAVFDKEIFDKKVIKKINAKCYPKLPASTLPGVLNRYGICVKVNDDKVILSNTLYTKMFVALDRWKKLRTEHSKGNNKYKYDSAFDYLDYRAFLPAYDITYESILTSMNDEVRKYISEINSLLISLGIKFCKPDRVRSLKCDYKGEHLLYYAIENTYPLMRTCMFKTHTPQYAEFVKEVEKLPNADEIKAFCFKGLNRCRACGCHPVPAPRLGYWTEVFGKKVKLCGGRRCFETSDFSRNSYEIMKTLIQINYKIIEGSNC